MAEVQPRTLLSLDSAWENAALWDFDGIGLPAWSAFSE